MLFQSITKLDQPKFKTGISNYVCVIAAIIFNKNFKNYLILLYFFKISPVLCYKLGDVYLAFYIWHKWYVALLHGVLKTFHTPGHLLFSYHIFLLLKKQRFEPVLHNKKWGEYLAFYIWHKL